MRIPYIKKFKRILQRKRIYRQTKSRWAGEQGYTVYGDEMLESLCQIRPQGYGGGQGEPVPDSIGDSPISLDTPTRPILGTEEVIEVARGVREAEEDTREAEEDKE